MSKQSRRDAIRVCSRERKTLRSLIAKGHSIIKEERSKPYPQVVNWNEVGRVSDDVAKLIEAERVNELVLRQLIEINKDPTRTGEAKDRIFTKLGAL